MNLFRIKYFFVILITICSINKPVLGMETPPQTPRHKVKPTPFQSPQSISSPVTNYCEKIITAFNNNDLNKVKDLWYEFFNKIPYPIKIGYKKIPEELPLQKATKLQLACFFCIAHCLAANTKKANPVYYNVNDNLIYFALKNNTGKYIFQFHATDYKNHEPIRHYQPETFENNEYKVIDININPSGISCKEINNTNDNFKKIKPVKLQYNQSNFFRTMLYEGFYNQEMKQLAKYLTEIYNKIPAKWRVDLEKFYQSVFAWICIFIGNSNITPEETTSRGRADVTIRLKEITNIVEFKRNQDTDKAIKQAKDRYAKTIHHTNKDTYLVGINVGTSNPNDIVVTCTSTKYIPIPTSPMAKAHQTSLPTGIMQPANDTKTLKFPLHIRKRTRSTDKEPDTKKKLKLSDSDIDDTKF